MKTKNDLILAVKEAEKALNVARNELLEWESLAENNVFDDLWYAVFKIEVRLYGLAAADCEGSYNCGQETYEQEFIVSGVRYLGTLECEYNRHDKTYYYVEDAKFSYKEL